MLHATTSSNAFNTFLVVAKSQASRQSLMPSAVKLQRKLHVAYLSQSSDAPGGPIT